MRPGDVVTDLRGQAMTVEAIDYDDGTVKCVWFERADPGWTLHRRWLDAVELEPCSECAS